MFAQSIFHAVSTYSVIRFPAASRLRILESVNGAELRFRALLSGECAPRLVVARGHRILYSHLSQRNHVEAECLRRCWVTRRPLLQT
jgi:hypothetical protein